MNRNLFGLLILIVIMVTVALCSCSSQRKYNVLFIRYIGATPIHGETIVECETVEEATKAVKALTWHTNDSIRIEEVILLK